MRAPSRRAASASAARAAGRGPPFFPVPGRRRTGRARREAGAPRAAGGVAADADGNIYGAEVGPKAVKKYVKGSATAERLPRTPEGHPDLQGIWRPRTNIGNDVGDLPDLRGGAPNKPEHCA